MPETKGPPLITVLVHLAVWAQLGVFTRAAIAKFFLMGCDPDSWGPCLQGSVYFKDLVPNMLGSFLIGLVASSSTLRISSDKPLVALSTRHPWQDNFALQLGIRTGYCGCLTTFSSWMLDIWTKAMQDNAWAEAVLALILGLQAALVSFVLGGHVALYCDRWWISEKEDVLKEEERYRSAETAEYRHEALSIDDDAMLHGPREASLQAIEGDLPRLIPPRVAERQQRQAEKNSVTSRHIESRSRFVEGDNEAAQTTQFQKGRSNISSHGPHRETNGAMVSPQTIQPVQDKSHRSQFLNTLLLLSITDVIACLGLIALVVGAAFGVAFETQHTWLRTAWLAVLFGPFGCFLRWKLSFYNYKLKGSWVWLPAGTLAANLLGTAVIFAVETALVKTNAGYWGDLVMEAVQMGFCGALSTVSTLVMELVKLSDVFPDSGHAYVYSTLTFVGGSVLAFVVFGWAAWS